jgi:hypothetical protein
MANNKRNRSFNKEVVTSVKKGILTPEEIGVLEGLLERLINNSKLTDKVKSILIQVLRSIGIVLGGITPSTPTTPSTNKKWWEKVLGVILNVASFVLPFILKSKRELRQSARKQRRQLRKLQKELAKQK